MNKASNSTGRITSTAAWGWENLHFLRLRLAGLRRKEAELTAYSEAELLSHCWQFVLRPKA